MLEAPEPVGVLVLEPDVDAMLIYSVAARPASQRLGYAELLPQFDDTRAQALGLSEIRLFTNAAMTATIRLYEAHGYRETGRRAHPARRGKVLVNMAKQPKAHVDR